MNSIAMVALLVCLCRWAYSETVTWALSRTASDQANRIAELEPQATAWVKGMGNLIESLHRGGEE